MIPAGWIVGIWIAGIALVIGLICAVIFYEKPWKYWRKGQK